MAAVTLAINGNPVCVEFTVAKADAAFSGSIAAIYDSHLGPLIFEPYAKDIVARLSSLSPKRILETAAGTGVLTRQLLLGLSDDVQFVATDLNQPMLDYASRSIQSHRLSWRKTDAQTLPFEDGEFDAVACQFGVMFFPDKVKAYREARRVLKPDGIFIFNAWDDIKENEFADLTTSALVEMFPDDPPLFLARTPHGYCDKSVIREDLRSAGFSDILMDTVMRRSVATSPEQPAIGFCQGTPLRNEIEARDASNLATATDMVARKISSHFENGRIDGKLQAHVIVAVR